MPLRLKLFKKRGEDGDTIVEVLIVLTVLSLAFAYAYATANSGLAQARNAQEHSQALGKLDSQVEMLRTAFSKDILKAPPTTPFCMAYSGTGELEAVPISGYTPPADRKADRVDNSPADRYPSKCKSENQLYHSSIVYEPGGHDSEAYFKIRVRWVGVGAFQNQQEEFVYKIQPLVKDYVPRPDPPPTVPQLNPIVTLNHDGTVPEFTFTWTINDLANGAGGPVRIECRYNSGPWQQNCTQPRAISSATAPPNSSHTFTVRASTVLGSGEDSYTWTNLPPPPVKPAKPQLAAIGHWLDDDWGSGTPNAYVTVTVYGVPNANVTLSVYNSNSRSRCGSGEIFGAPRSGPTLNFGLNSGGTATVNVPVETIYDAWPWYVFGAGNQFTITVTQTASGLTSDPSRVIGNSKALGVAWNGSCNIGVNGYVNVVSIDD